MARIGERRNVCMFLSVNMKERYHLEDLGVGDSKMDLQEIGWESLGWIDLPYHRVSGGLLRACC